MARDSTVDGQFASEVAGGGGASRVVPLAGGIISVPTNDRIGSGSFVVPGNTKIDIISGFMADIVSGPKALLLADTTDADPGGAGELLYSIPSSGIVAGKPLSSVTFSENRELSVYYENQSDTAGGPMYGNVVISLDSDNEDAKIIPPVDFE